MIRSNIFRGMVQSVFVAALLAVSPHPFALSGSAQDMNQMPDMGHTPAKQEQTDSMSMSMNMNMPGMGEPKSLLDAVLVHSTSGTSIEPPSTPVPMLMSMHGSWMLMLHGTAFVVEQQQTGPRGADKFFSTNWIMPMAQRSLGHGELTLRDMFSLEPATISDRRYPELFQQGETAYGQPITDGQHPHNFFMELAGLYDLRMGERSLLSFYGAIIGDPALGPTAYPHRASAAENPLATLGHHEEDSTHIASDVITVGATSGPLRLEASGFHGREPGENRWTIPQGAIDSWSTRLTAVPARNWSVQYSIGKLNSPEQTHPDEDNLRMTASVSYNRPITHGNWASMLAWGRNRDSGGGNIQIYNAYLLESTMQFGRVNYVWIRIENADRSSDLLADGETASSSEDEHFLARVQAYTAGYARDIPLIPHLKTSLGAQATFYAKPSFLTPYYGDHPAGVAVFLRLRPF